MSRAGIARGALQTHPRGIDLFNAMAAAEAAKKSAQAAKNKPAPKKPLQKKGLNGETQLSKVPGSSSEVRVAGTTISDDGTVIVKKKETREEYKARREAQAAARAEREKTSKLRACEYEFRHYCHDNKACINCGWPGHRKEECTKGEFIPVWNEEKKEWDFIEQGKSAGAKDADVPSEKAADKMPADEKATDKKSPEKKPANKKA